MKSAIMQPTYIPWLGYFDLIDRVDTFVFLDNVQLVKRSWQVRNRIKTVQRELFLTIPIKKKQHRDDMLINSAYISYDEDWKRKHVKSIELSYKRSPYFQEVFPFILSLYDEKTPETLSEFNIYIIKEISKKLNITTTFINSSALENISGHKDTLLCNICKCIGSDYYISPAGSADYIEEKSDGGEFTKNNIQLFYHNFEHPNYMQPSGEFIPYMCIYDLILNIGFEKSLNIIRSGRKAEIDYLTFRQKYRSNTQFISI